ncbi:MAG: bifunctional (p)ppGpp synthetase/guanosine-3',5'-bis(diphosphate) 3'-pyrophosphohydrolase [Clostridia bacterium]|nr:bifunctional (p)ppGpp synthetase/guanosine-3',5'-bis(diphosphate) 3'-pyrophosphohydrolase [Clostridia bacterium]
MNTYEGLVEKIKAYGPNADFDKLQRAYEFARELHRDQKRVSGEPYITHPLEVAHILADLQMDSSAVIAAILHDVVEDTSCTLQEISDQFGAEVAMLVDGVTKLDLIQFTNKEEQQIESLRKMFLAMAKDVRVILIKLADRLHNMRTLRNIPPEKQRIKARETLEVYAPLAHRLGIQSIKSELEDMSLRYLDSVAYYEIAENIKQKKTAREKYIDDIVAVLKEKLDAIGIEATVYGRAKNIYSIYRKMYTQNKSIDEIYDLFAVRVIVNTINECYAVLGMVHEMYMPMPGRFKDYIAMPKPNMYRSLHSTVIGPEGKPCEIQIRTHEMHQTAELGIAAHWRYKEGGKIDKTDQNIAWIRQLLDIQKDLDNAEDFMETLKIDLFADEVFVFTPRGDVINLPAGSTPIDFAFAIHSAIGCKMQGARVNSKIVPIDYKLKTGDIVEIITSPNVHGPSRDWLAICKTSQAKSKINQWFKKENREKNIEIGRESIEKEAKKLGIPLQTLMKKEYLEQYLRRFGYANLDDLYAAIGFGSVQASKVASKLKEYNRELTSQESELVLDAPPKPAPGSNIAVKGIDNCLVRVSRCCTPLPGDEIVGFITKGRGVSVHRKDCVNLQNLPDKAKARLIECVWADETKGRYLCDLIIEATTRRGLLTDVTLGIGDYKIPIAALNLRTMKNNLAVIETTLEVTDTQLLDALVKRLYTVPGVYKIIRAHS